MSVHPSQIEPYYVVESTSDPTVSDTDYFKGARWRNTATGEVFECTDPSVATWISLGGGTARDYQLTLGGELDCPTLPLTGVGIELAAEATTLTTFRARRGTAGTSGTTTIQLEINGSPIGGATLSWTNADANNALKTVTISQAISADDRISFRLTSAEVGAVDIYARAA